MRVTAVVVIVLSGLALSGPAGSVLAQEAEAQTPADAYMACIVGNAVVAALRDGYEGGDAGIRGLALCDTMVPDVPEAAAIEGEFIELWDNRLGELLFPAE
jgi:hypothetical protein